MRSMAAAAPLFRRWADSRRSALQEVVHLADGLAQAFLHAHLQHLLHLLEAGELVAQLHARAAFVLEEPHPHLSGLVGERLAVGVAEPVLDREPVWCVPRADAPPAVVLVALRAG